MSVNGFTDKSSDRHFKNIAWLDQALDTEVSVNRIAK